jgi:hypothetical protein
MSNHSIEVFGLPAKKAVKRFLGLTHLPTQDMMVDAYERMLREEPDTLTIRSELGFSDPRVRRRVTDVVQTQRQCVGV